MSSRLGKVGAIVACGSNELCAYSTSGAILATAKDFEGLRGIVPTNIVVALNRRNSYVKLARMPNARPSELDSIVKLQASTMFPNGVGQLVYAYHSTSDVTSEGRLSLLIAASMERMLHIYSQAEAAGFKVEGAIPDSVGSIVLAREFGIKDGAIVEAVDDGIGIDVIHGGMLAYSRMAPHGSDVPSEVQLAHAAAGTPGGTTHYIDREGAGSQSSVQALSRHLFEFESTVLEPVDSAEKRFNTVVNNRARFASLMALAAVGVVAVVWDGRDRAAVVVQKGRAEYLAAIRSATKARDTESAKATKTGALVSEVRRGFEPAQSAGDVLAVIGSEVPPNVWLTGITFERGKSAILRGSAMDNESVGSFLDSLNSNERFRDVKLAFANQALIETTNIVQFSMSAHVVGNLPIVKSKKERGRK